MSCRQLQYVKEVDCFLLAKKCGFFVKWSKRRRVQVVSQRYMSVEICKIENISKIYPGFRALDDVSMEIRKGEIHGIIERMEQASRHW
jgi:ABC-type glutathione transport system ATPase component